MKIRFIINSHKAGGDRIIRLILNRFARHECETFYTQYSGHAEEIAKDSLSRAIGCLVAVGGDGTVNEVVNGVCGSGIPIGIIPSGSANDLACQLNIPENIESAADIILAGKIKYQDAIQFNDRIILTTGGLGFPAYAIKSARSLSKSPIIPELIRQYINRRLYIWGALLAIFGSIPKFTVSAICDDRTYSFKLMSLIISNKPVLGKYFRLFPAAYINGESLGLYLIEAGNRFILLKNVVGKIKGKHRHLSGARYLKGNKIALNITPAARLFGDGELFESTNYLYVQIIPDAVPIIVPQNRECRS